ncbi:sulfite exporter TauE/SafE family protein [Ketobacter sp.]|uniref:sulfite exporter TauE/SafE family protein n=1 Tax=Ketobacter sp. TaxID=2083498 RepID=UPI000F1B2A67|nr:sulfite exporter TauE/SafE family protein [Ketobacter sp.]RLT92651.1 MAG: sulfite exporter TauE/SafE family protein [Ketobacter sp.]
MEFLIYPALGVMAGLAAGLLGVGGGLIIVPVLIYSFSLLGFPPEVLTHMAVGTSLATIILTSFGSVYQHHRKGAVLWPILTWYALGLAVGAFLGAKLADVIHGRLLQILFGVFAILIAIQMASGVKPRGSRELPGALGLSLTGGIIGAVSAIFGIGGGSLSVPFLTWCNVKMQQAVATSAAGGMPIALAGSLGFVLAGWDKPVPEYSLGYVYLPALLGIAVTSVLFALVGARLAHRLPAATLKKIFAGLLLLVGVKLLLG